MKNIIYTVAILYFSLIINVQASESNYKNTLSQASVKTSKGTRINKNINYIKVFQGTGLSELEVQKVAVDRRGKRADYSGILLGRSDLMSESKNSNTRSK